MKNISSQLVATTGYLSGKVTDNVTRVSELINNDIVQFFQKLVDISGLSISDLYDNETNGYDTIKALMGTVYNLRTITEAGGEIVLGDENFAYITSTAGGSNELEIVLPEPQTYLKGRIITCYNDNAVGSSHSVKKHDDSYVTDFSQYSLKGKQIARFLCTGTSWILVEHKTIDKFKSYYSNSLTLTGTEAKTLVYEDVVYFDSSATTAKVTLPTTALKGRQIRLHNNSSVTLNYRISSTDYDIEADEYIVLEYYDQWYKVYSTKI